MKKPYLNQFERFLLKESPDYSMSQTIKFRLAMAYFKREVGRAIEPILKLILK